MRRCVIALATCIFVGLGLGCGGTESRDRPEECTEDEYYDEQTELCTPCPSIAPPDCPQGCGYEIYELENGCEAARCAPNCEYCGVGAYFSEDEAVCKTCPGAPDCEQFSCTGELRVEGSYRAPCPPVSAYGCGGCDAPEDGCREGDGGRCVDVSD